MLRTHKSLLALCLLAASSTAMAASTAQITVTGQVLPTACTPSFANNGAIEYDNLSHGDLNADTSKFTNLATKNLGFTINCTSATALATTWVDNKPDHNDIPSHVSYFGFGKDASSNPIGRLWVQYRGSTAQGDGEPVDVIHSLDKQSWEKNAYGQVSKVHYTSFAAVGETTPKAFTTYSGDMQLKPIVRPTAQMDMSGALEIDSSITMEVVYL
ncbi:DUF1120 domain-containing protein [Pseudomonas abieticivorans]|uniref:DUF1120 domain-containing protein n=1 Tax=Pseudomonas abieticivorans TaxID=2931382 RepID=UPI0020BEB376|nr:DUF1120 domain-containing protein [Pseudomonas sp. PIA16]